MTFDLKNLPEDTALLHAIIADLAGEVDSLQAQLALLKAKRFGTSSEKLDKQIDELEQQIEDNEIAAKPRLDADESAKNKAKRKPLPEHFPRENVTLNPDLKCSECGAEDFRKIADDISEVLEYKPSSFKVIRTIRPRCACINCENIIQAELPSGPIAKGKAGPGLLAHILVQKYANHLPLYRQSQIYEREGLDLCRSTMAGWVGQCSKLLEPLITALQADIFESEQIHGDDTPIRVLAPGLGKTKTGRIWAYVRDGRPFGCDTPPAVCYFYSPDRKALRPEEHLKSFAGTLHADAYAGYNNVYKSAKNPEATAFESACWSHTRRKFYEVTVAIPNAGIAAEALDKIGELYKIEEEIRGSTAAKRLKNRQKHSQKLVDDFFDWLKKCRAKLPKKSQTTKAINYALNQEAGLRHFLTDGHVEIDNNAAERAMRSIALGRKNWMFAGSDKGGEYAASIFSLMETAKLNSINPQEYLTHVLKNIKNHNSNKIHELLPWNIKLTD
jgi:transposase